MDKRTRPPACATGDRASEVEPVSYLLKRAAQYSADLFTGQLGDSGLTQRQVTLLNAISHNDGASQTELVRETGIDRSTLADLVARLESNGHVERRRNKSDARINKVFLTKKGLDAVNSTQPQVSIIDQALLETVPVRHRKSFVSALEQLSDQLDGHGS